MAQQVASYEQSSKGWIPRPDMQTFVLGPGETYEGLLSQNGWREWSGDEGGGIVDSSGHQINLQVLTPEQYQQRQQQVQNPGPDQAWLARVAQDFGQNVADYLANKYRNDGYATMHAQDELSRMQPSEVWGPGSGRETDVRAAVQQSLASGQRSPGQTPYTGSISTGGSASLPSTLQSGSMLPGGGYTKLSEGGTLPGGSYSPLGGGSTSGGGSAPSGLSGITPENALNYDAGTLSQLSNEQLGPILDALVQKYGSQVLTNFSADRLGTFDIGYQQLFQKALEGNPDAKAVQLAKDLGGIIQNAGGTPYTPAAQPGTAALPSTPAPGAPTAALPSTGGTPGTPVGFHGNPYGTESTPALQAQYGLARYQQPDMARLAQLTSGSALERDPLAIYQAYLGGGQAQLPRTSETYSRLAGIIDANGNPVDTSGGGGTTDAGGGVNLPSGVVYDPGTKRLIGPPGTRVVFDPATGQVILQPAGTGGTGSPGLADLRAAQTNNYAADNARADAALALNQSIAEANIAQRDAQQKLDELKFRYSMTKDQRDFEAYQSQLQITNALNQKKSDLEQQQAALATQLGYANSERQDFLANQQLADRTGYYAGAPTLGREQAIGTNDRANTSLNAQLGLNAANLAADAAKFAYQRAQSPFSFVERAYKSRGMDIPVSGSGTLSGQQMIQGTPGLGTAFGDLSGTATEQSNRTTLPYLSGQGRRSLNPSEVQSLDAVNLATGVNPDDYWAQQRRLTQSVGAPGKQYATLRSAQGGL